MPLRLKIWGGYIFENSKNFPAPFLKPVDVQVSLKLMEKNMNYRFTHILFIESALGASIYFLLNIYTVSQLLTK